MILTTWRAAVIFKCIVTARIDLNRLLQLIHMASITHVLSEITSSLTIDLASDDDSLIAITTG